MLNILRVLPLLVVVACLGMTTAPNAAAQSAGGKLNSPVNDAVSTMNDYAAFVTQEDGKDVLIFTTDRRRKENGEPDKPIHTFKVREAEFFRSTRPISGRESMAVNQGWSDPVRLSDSDKLAERHYNRGSYAKHGNTVVFSAEQELSSEFRGSSFLLNLWMTTDNFQTFTELKNISNNDAWDSQPTFSRDGRTLFFVSNRLENLQDTLRDNNIWYCQREGEGWSDPKPLTDVNTPGDDLTPSVGPDGYFYLASNWKGEGTGDYDIFRCKLRINGMPLGPPRKLEESFADDYARRPLLPDNLEYNSSADDFFPHVAQWGDDFVLFLTSNRTGDMDSDNAFRESIAGLDLYAFEFPWPKICLEVHVRRKVVAAGANPDDFPWQAYKSDLIVNEIGGERRNVSSDTEISLEGRREYSLQLAETDVDCGDCIVYYPDAPGKQSGEALHFFAGSRDSCLIRDTIDVVCMLRRDSVSLRAQDAAGFFITGYWKPTTRENYAEFEKRWESGALEKSGFVDPFDFNYASTAARVEDHFERQVYQRIDDILTKFDNSCLGIQPMLRITVHGYTDECGLSDGLYTADGDIEVGGTKIASGQRMWASSLPAVGGGVKALPGRGQRGNVILSKLRAHFTAQLIINTMRKRNPQFREYYDNGQIVIDADGYGIFGQADCDTDQRIDDFGLENQPVKHVASGLTEDKEKTARYKFKTTPGGEEILDEPCNNPLSRRMTVYFDVIDAAIQKDYKVGRCGFESPEYLRWELRGQSRLIAEQKAKEEERAKRALAEKEVELSGSVETIEDPEISESAGPVYVLQLARASSKDEALMVQTILRLLDFENFDTFQQNESSFRFVDKRRFEFESDATNARRMFEQRVTDFCRGLEQNVVEENKLEELLQSTVSAQVGDSE